MVYLIVRVGRYRIPVRIFDQAKGLCQATVDGRTFGRNNLLQLVRDLEKWRETRLPTTMAIKPSVGIR